MFSQRTLWVIVATGFSLAVLLFFQHLPQGFRWPVRLLFVGAVLWLLYLAFCTLRILALKFSGKKFCFSLLLGLMLYGMLHLVCHVFIKLMAARDDRLATRVVTTLAKEQKHGIEAMMAGTSYEMYDREIGWVPRPLQNGEGAQINAQGVRSLKEYPIPAPDPDRRILCLGDSFTFGHGVGDTETFPYHGEQLRPGTEWVNLGISGACLTQCLLQYRKNGRKFGGKYVVIGFMTDDAKRTVNCFRSFLTQFNPFTKPFAKYSHGKFSIEPNPYQNIEDYQKLLTNETPEMERLLQMDYLTWSNQVATHNPVLRTAEYIYEALHVDRSLDSLLLRPTPKHTKPLPRTSSGGPKQTEDPYGRIIWDSSANHWTKKTGSTDPYGKAIWNPDSLGFIALTKVFELLHQEILADGRVPLIVVIPGPFDVENYAKQYPKQYGSLLDHLQAKGYHYFDYLDPLVAKHADDLSIDTLFVSAHYRSAINQELAAAVIKALKLP